MEKKQEITEEQVKEYQMLLAQWMQLPMDALEILNEDMPWRIREWLYVCALDQIPGAELQAMKPQGLKKIQDIRAQFLKQKFQGLKEIQTQLNALQKQIEEGEEKQATVLSRLQAEVLQIDPWTFFQHFCHMLMVQRLIFLTVVLACRVRTVIRDDSFTSILRQSKADFRMNFMEVVHPRTIVFHFPAIPSEIMVVAFHICNPMHWSFDRCHGHMRDRRQTGWIHFFRKSIQFFVIFH